jgi:hypothetical protein
LCDFIGENRQKRNYLASLGAEQLGVDEKREQRSLSMRGLFLQGKKAKSALFLILRQCFRGRGTCEEPRGRDRAGT